MEKYKITQLLSSLYGVTTSQLEGGGVLKYAPSSERDAVLRLRREFQFLNKINSPHVMKPIAIEELEEGVYLEFPKLPGEPLGQKTLTALSLDALLRISSQMTLALVELHQRKILHRDLRLESFLYDPSEEKITLWDFSSATETPHVVAFTPIDNLVGSFPFMSPEQTGRVFKSIIDDRSDIYSLGITLYQLFTGRLPFAAQDPSGWIYCHIAKPPQPITDFRQDLPRGLCTMIHTCIHKNPEERYQSVYGLYTDLSLIIKDPDFNALRQSDVSTLFKISDRLYGRDSDLNSLRSALQHLKNSEVGFYLIGGPAGIGKTKLVGQVHSKVFLMNGGYYSCKFDQYSNAKPYAGILNVMESLLKSFFQLEKPELDSLKQRLRKALGIKGKILLDYLPVVSQFLGEFPSLPNNLDPKIYDSELRTQFIHYFKTLVSLNKPAVVFIDDLQWADLGSLVVLGELLISKRIQGLFIIGAYRSNEVAEGHPFRIFLNRMTREGVTWHEAQIGPLKLDHIAQLVADSTHLKTCDPGVAELSHFLFQKTSGNPFFITQVLNQLVSESLISLDQQNQCWHWSIKEILEAGITEDLLELLVKKTKELSQPAFEILKVAACIERQFNLDLINCITQFEHPEDIIHEPLKDNLVIEVSRHPIFKYRFTHDKIREAFYHSTSDQEKEIYHFKIATLLTQHRSNYQARDLDLAEHYSLSPSQIELVGKNEALKIWNILVNAGLEAQQAFASDKAETFYSAALKIYENWKENWDKETSIFPMVIGLCDATLKLQKEERYLELVKLFRMNQLLNSDDHLEIKIAKLKFLGERGMHQECGHLFREILDASFNIKAGNPDRDNTPSSIIFEIIKLHINVLSITKKEFNNLKGSQSSDPLQISNEIEQQSRRIKLLENACRSSLASTFIAGQPYKYILTTSKLFNYLNTIGIYYNNIFINGLSVELLLGNYDLIIKWYPKLSLIYSDENLPACAVFYWYKAIYYPKCLDTPLVVMLDTVRKSAEIALKLDYGIVLDLATSAKLAVLLDMSLENFQEEVEETFYLLRNSTSSFSQGVALAFALLYHRLRHGDADQAPDQSVFQKPLREEDTFTGIAAQCFFSYYYRCRWDILKQDWNSAQFHYIKALENENACIGSYFEIEFRLFYAVIFLRTGKTSFFKLRSVGSFLKKINAISPKNWGYAYWIFQAEVARFVHLDYLQSQKFYLKALEATRASGARFIHSLTLELLADLMKSELQQRQVAYFYIQLACESWMVYGASHKVIINKNILFKDLFDEFQHQYQLNFDKNLKSNTEVPLSPLPEVVKSSSVHSEANLSPILMAARRLSEQQSLSSMVSHLLNIITETVQADHAVILLWDSNTREFWFEGELGEAGVKDVLSHLPWRSNPSVPELMIRFFLNSNLQRYSLSDLPIDPQFEQDSYFLRHQPQSLCCFMIRHHEQNIGIIYIENKNIKNCFTEKQIDTLELLCSPIAVSIKNLKIVENLEGLIAQKSDAVQRRTQKLTALFHSLKYGVFTFGVDFCCEAEYSPHTCEIVGLKNPEGHNLIEILTEEMPPDSRNQIFSALGMAFDEPRSITWDLNSWLLPQSLIRHGRVLELEWEPIEQAQVVTSVLVLVRDVTALRVLEAESQDHKLHLQIGGEVLEAKGEEMAEFLQSAEGVIAAHEAEIHSMNKDFVSVLRDLHSLKGSARSLRLKSFATVIHETEAFFLDLKNDPDSYPDEPLFKRKWSSLSQHLGIYRNYFERISRHSTEDRAFPSTIDLKQILRSLETWISDTALALGRLLPHVELRNLGDNSAPFQIEPRLQKMIKTSLIHLLGNSLNHGIEKPEVRLSLGKPAQGKILIQTDSTSRQILLSDDGAGIHLKALRALMPSSAPAPTSDRDVVNSIFKQGVSTSYSITEISGRGLGMDAVRAGLEELGCHIEIQFGDDAEGADFRKLLFIIALGKKSSDLS